MPRSRMSLDPVPAPIPTIAMKGVEHEYEDFILGEAADRVRFQHWTAHLRSFWGWHAEEPDYNVSDQDIPFLRDAIAVGLHTAGYPEFATEIVNSGNSEDINRLIFAQYTADSDLYREINRLLRTAHSGARLDAHPLAPWILQLNSALRLRPPSATTVYRGVEMSPDEMSEYRVGLMFVWAGFVSASKNPQIAFDFGGTVQFEITPWGAYDMYGKRDPLDIAALSQFPSEQEVVFPLACTFRVTSTRQDGSRTAICLQSVDQY